MNSNHLKTLDHPFNILILGKGAREHALALKLRESIMVNKIFVLPGNGGIKDSEIITNIKDDDFKAIKNFVINNEIHITIVGSEIYLKNGITDYFRKHNLFIFGPDQATSQLETSKFFAKELMKHQNISTANYQRFTDFETVASFLDDATYPLVIKYDGLAAGKGVTIVYHKAKANAIVDNIFNNLVYGPNPSVLIEECLFGWEFTVISLVKNKTFYSMIPVQDYKRSHDGNLGENTGGMGCYGPVPLVTSEMLKFVDEQVIVPILEGLHNKGLDYFGFLYTSLIVLKDNTIKVIEFNVRLGDPEAEVLLALLNNDLMLTLWDLWNDRPITLSWKPMFALGVSIVANGYPLSSYPTLIPIEGLHKVKISVFHMSTVKINNKIFSNGGRILFFLAIDKTLAGARNKVYREINKINNKFFHFRKDIGII